MRTDIVFQRDIARDLNAVFQSWIIQYWKIQYWKNLYWKTAQIPIYQSFILSSGIRKERQTEFVNPRIYKAVFEHPKVIVFPDQKCVQEALLSAAFSPPKCVSGSAFCMRKGAAKLAAPCAVAYLLFPTFPSVCSVSR